MRLLFEYGLTILLVIAVCYVCSLLGEKIRDRLIARHGFAEGYSRYKKWVFAWGVGLFLILPAALFVIALVAGLLFTLGKP